MYQSIKLQKVIVAIIIATYSLAMTIASSLALLVILSGGAVAAMAVVCVSLAAGMSGLFVSASAVGFNVPCSEKAYWIHLVCSMSIFGFAAFMLKLTSVFGSFFLGMAQAGRTIPDFQGMLHPYSAGVLLFAAAPVYLGFLWNRERSARRNDTI